MLKYHIQTVELTSTQSSISLNEIPQNYDDLILTVSGRSTRSGEIRDEVQVRFNQDSNSNYTLSGLRGSGSSIAPTASNGNSALTRADMPAGNASANTFSNISYYISNYKANAQKSVTIDTVMENNATDSFMYILAGLWNNTAPITNISMRPEVASFASGSSISLYGVKRGTDASSTAAASGGVITASGGYTIHTFSTSGTFVPNRDLNVDYLVVAGGGGGGAEAGGGGGAGGVRSTVTATGGGGALESSLAVSANTSYTVSVGAGGPGKASNAASRGDSGSNSVFGSVTSVGGGGGGQYQAGGGFTGGSGGGAPCYNVSSFSPGSGTTNQGFAGGTGVGNIPSAYGGGGGGGAGAAGGNGSATVGGVGGTGIATSISGSSVFYGGGGGGAIVDGTPALGGAGGGGTGGKNAVPAVSAIANTGGGGGGGGGGTSPTAGGNGGSGIVIIRYLTP